jgi:GNAT superfamily N-acetyltransferase
MEFALRTAIDVDIPKLERMIQASARRLARGDYTEAQIEAALRSAWGVDTQLIRDETYFVVESNGVLAACGGWSRRKTLFGSDAQAEREPELLDPKNDAARIRAFFVHPDFARRGIGRLLLKRCEAEASREGFNKTELLATLPGVKLYAACGYEVVERTEYPLEDGIMIVFVRMRKERI